MRTCWAWVCAAVVTASAAGLAAPRKQASPPTTTDETVPAPQPDRSPYLIGYSCDGNQHDLDDIGSSAMALALIGAAGLQDRLAHFDYNNHLGDNNPERARMMAESVLGAAERWGIPRHVLFDDQTALDKAIQNLARRINESGPDRPFYLCAAGPMEVIWRGIQASDPARRSFCTVISHSTWNDHHADTPELRHRWVDLERSGVRTVKIPNQNRNLSTAYERWHWLKDASRPEWRWLYDQCRNKRTFDVSDAGMVWYVLTGRGDECGTPETFRAWFERGGQPAQPAANP